MKLSGYKMEIQFDKDPLDLERNNFLAKIINVSIVYDLVAWPRTLTNNFKFKNCLIGANNLVKK